VLRTGRKLAAALTLLGDAGKGAVAVGLGSLIAPAGGDAAALAGIAAFLGHLFPVFFGFRGGKGVATAAGILLALDPRLGGLTLGVWLVMAVVFRYSSLAAVSAALVAPFGAAWFGAGPVGTVAVVAMSALLLWRHRGNLARLLAGQETRIGSGRRGAAAGKAG
jgi:glycerol-3-phosphate acyltransferase PlsY